jgi:hypothetical protein
MHNIFESVGHGLAGDHVSFRLSVVTSTTAISCQCPLHFGEAIVDPIIFDFIKVCLNCILKSFKNI